jgi:hypothetical protein
MRCAVVNYARDLIRAMEDDIRTTNGDPDHPACAPVLQLGQLAAHFARMQQRANQVSQHAPIISLPS